MGNTLWWVLFFMIGIWLQRFLPGIDVLVSGLLVALGERRPIQLAVVLGTLIVLQEGMGTLDFGASVLWYGIVVCLFYGGHWLFETENFLFMFMLGGCLGAAHYGVLWTMSRLQFIPVTPADLLDEGILQALFTPFAWRFVLSARRWMVSNDEDTA